MASKIGVDFVWTHPHVVGDTGQQDFFNEDRIKCLLEDGFTELMQVTAKDPMDAVDVTVQIFTDAPVELSQHEVQHLIEIWQQLGVLDEHEFPKQVEIPLTSGDMLVYNSGL